VGRLGVVPDLARQGLGSAMLRFAEAQLPEPVTRIELLTGLHSVGNHAFYRGHGYDVTERNEAHGFVRMAKRVAR
jgi:ribosomal protein S18 acetylase RimI-like enzyme